MSDTSRHLLPTTLLLLVSLPFGTREAWSQQTINVPATQPTIQAGIDAAIDGDTVLVAPGTYVENIDFKGKAITVTSSAGAASTIIDASQGDIGVRFVNNETRSSVINGFTIKNAGLSMWPNNSPSIYFDGIKVAYNCPSCSSNPTITNNIITQNYGYGIVVYFGGAYISGNTISHTSTQYDPRFDFGCDYDDGSGIALQGTSNDPSITAVISDNVIEQNLAQCGGGGIRLYSAGAPTITNNVIRYNESKGEGGGIWMVNGNAMSIIQNVIDGNVAGTAGGGIYLGNSSQNLFIVNNTIVGNTIFLNPNIITPFEDGSQLAINGSVSGTAFFNNVLVAADNFAAIACDPIYQYLSTTPLVIDHSDVLNFSGPLFGGWCMSPPTITSNMISLDAQFVTTANGSLRLGSGSPAVDAGNSSAPNLPSVDLAGNPRTQGNAVDMGAYEGTFVGNSNTPPDFTLSSAPSSLIIMAGQSATTMLTVSPVGGFIGTVSFSCSGLPATVPCSFSRGALAVGGDNAILTTTLTVYASAASSHFRKNSVLGAEPWSFRVALVWGGLLPCLLLISGNMGRFDARLKTMRLVLITLLAMSLGAVLSCGGGSTGTGQSGPPPNHSPSTFTMVVQATATGNTARSSHTLNVTVVITQ